jgi:hypothetical protein
MLCGNAELGFKVGEAAAEFEDQGAELDGFRPGAEDHKDFIHERCCLDLQPQLSSRPAGHHRIILRPEEMSVEELSHRSRLRAKAE